MNTKKNISLLNNPGATFFVGQEPNNSVYLAPFTMPCGEPCGLIGNLLLVLVS